MTSYGRRAFSYARPHVWNSLSEHLNQSINIRLMRGMSKRRPTHVWHTNEWT